MLSDGERGRIEGDPLAKRSEIFVTVLKFIEGSLRGHDK
jgi:hypothetical protein